ncbi:8-oxo-dGTP pyrophosphatase MutT (NUDIX family) [Rhodococcus sp. 27YEA15]|uniref:NUDIX hydrolase n=1 Tax=Rhodococcus sp. 27YEA15 TaxID=3156259 RepID=UPI003C7E9796
MTFSALTIFVLGLVAAVVLVVGLWAYATANRLDRLHVRSDQSWLALDAALSRRAAVVRAAAVDMSEDDARRFASLADTAERADRVDRELAENRLSNALAAYGTRSLRPQLVAELADSEARVLIARRFHNDVVRDTLALRTRRMVRLLHLGGTAQLPQYFEISERTTAAAVPEGITVDTSRTSARVLLIDDQDRVLLLRGHDPKIPGKYFWFTVGGGLERGEHLRGAAVREVAEETGLVVTPSDLRGPLWRRVAIFPFDGELIRSEELFFATRTRGFEPVFKGHTELEKRAITGHRWCDAATIVELSTSGEPVYPIDLAQLLPEAVTVADGAEDPEVRAIT